MVWPFSKRQPKPEIIQAKFDLAQTTVENQKHWANADGLSARAAVSPGVRRVVRLRSRYEAENNSWYRGILRTAVNHIVGKGPRLQVLTGNRDVDNRIEALWRQWSKQIGLSRKLRTAVDAYWRDGECFAMQVRRQSLAPIPLDISVYEADQIASPWTTPTTDRLIDDGIRVDEHTNELSVYVLDNHPGDNFGSSLVDAGQWYPAREVLHLYREERPRQTRGIPRATSALQTLPIMRRQELATLFSAETAANFALFLKSNSPELVPQNSPADFAEIEITRNMLTTLPSGWDIGQVEPKQPGPLYEMFQRQALTSFSRCTNMPYALAAGTSRDSNFSSLRGDMKNVWEPEVKVEQDEIECRFIEPILSWFLEALVFVPGALDGAPPISEIKRMWHWPPLPELDALNAAKAAQIRLETGQSTPTKEYALKGEDWESESSRAAEDYGVSPEEYRRMVLSKLLGAGSQMPADHEDDIEETEGDENMQDEPQLQANDASQLTHFGAVSVELEAAEGDKARRFSILAYSGGTLPVEGFPVPVVVDLQGLEASGSIPILIDHTKSVEATLGQTDSIENNGSQLTLGGFVTASSQLTKQVLAQSDAGHKWQASIGAHVTEREIVEAGQTVIVNGQTFQGPVIVARKSSLRETSVLPMGADSKTSVNLAASANLKGMAEMTFDEWLGSMNLEASAMSAENLAAMQLAFEAKTAPVQETQTVQAAAGVDVAAQAQIDLQAALAEGRKLQAAQLRKTADIQAKASGHPMIAAKAIEEDWSLEKVELEVLKASAMLKRPTSFSAAEDDRDNEPNVLEAALCVHRKISDVEKQFDDKTLQAAHRRFRGGLGLKQMIITAAAHNGMPTYAGMQIADSNMAEVLSYAKGQNIQASFSTLSLPGILSNVANKEALQGYMEEDNVWRQIAAVKSVSDFKQVTSYRMLSSMEYEKLGPDGQIKHGTVGEESYTRKADTYAKMFAITRTDIINDDLGMFDDIRNVLGRGGAQKLNNVFWATFMDNSTFYTTARTNYFAGATTNLGADGVGLTKGVEVYRKRTSPTADGAKRLGGRPTKLLVPPELEAIADQLYSARNSGAVKASDVNTHAGKYEPIVANQLSDSGFTGHSATAWYLLGDGEMSAPVAVSFLNGQETPTVEAADTDFNTLGIQFRGYHDFGCDLAEYLGSVKSKGAA